MDLSTIVVSAIGSFPAQFMESSMSTQREVTDLSKSFYKKHITINMQDEKNLVEVVTGAEMKADDLANLFDAISPKYNSVSGPLVFIGASIFQFQEFTVSGKDLSTDPADWTIAFFIRLLVI